MAAHVYKKWEGEQEFKKETISSLRTTHVRSSIEKYKFSCNSDVLFTDFLFLY